MYRFVVNKKVGTCSATILTYIHTRIMESENPLKIIDIGFKVIMTNYLSQCNVRTFMRKSDLNHNIMSLTDINQYVDLLSEMQYSNHRKK